MLIRRHLILPLLWLLILGTTRTYAQTATEADAVVAPSTVKALSAWNDTASRQALIAFVEKVTDKNSPEFVPAGDRIAVFDNDGTLWCEKPIYPQVRFALDQVELQSKQHPEWKQKPLFRAAIDQNWTDLEKFGKKGILELVVATHSGMTTTEFGQRVASWIKTARHPRFQQPYTSCTYLPMLQVLSYLREHGFQTFIVSGGGVDFMRVFSDPVYGVPTPQVVGSTIKTSYELRGDEPVLVQLPEINFVDDHAGKPVGIHQRIGKRPILAFGNSDGDYEMLQYVTAGSGARLGLLIHHTDAKREYAYDRQSPVGRLDRALDEADKRGWIVVDMKQDWNQIFQFESPQER